MYAASNGEVKVIATLLQHGANFNLKNNDEKTALEIAEQNKQYNAVSVLKRMYRFPPAASKK